MLELDIMSVGVGMAICLTFQLLKALAVEISKKEKEVLKKTEQPSGATPLEVQSKVIQRFDGIDVSDTNTPAFLRKQAC